MFFNVLCLTVVVESESHVVAVGIELLAAVVCCQIYLKRTCIPAVVSCVANNYFTVGSLSAYK